MADRNWNPDLFKRYEVVASPSQLAQILDCSRAWWFRRCARLPEVQQQDKFDFGNALHGVMERWLRADDTGRDLETGKPVELFPAGWAGPCNAKEQALIKVLFELAVSDGLIRRLPGREIEKEFEVEVIPGVGMIGAMDIVSPEGVEDHKSTEDTRYIMSPEALASDPKMLAYAKIFLDWFPDRESVKIRLNYVVKDPDAPSTRAIEAIVSRDDVERFWKETIVPAAESMLRLKRAKLPETEWSRVTGPQGPGICRKYGGCPRAKVCGRVQSVQSHRAEIDRINGKKNQPKTPNPNPTMSFFGKKLAAQAPAVPDPAPLIAAANAARAAANAPAPEPASAPAVPTPPWHTPGCQACVASPGISSKGAPCKACDAVSGRSGRPTSQGFNYGIDDSGAFWWAPKAAEAPVQETTVQAPAPEEAEKVQVVAEAKPKKTRTKAAKTKTKEVPDPLTPPEAEALEEFREALGGPAVLTVDEGPAKMAETTGFRLYINCIPLDEDYIELTDILQRESQALAAALGVESYYTIDAFRRRDALASKIEAVVHEDLPGRNVVALGASQDLKAYLDALRPFASAVVLGVF